MSFYARPDSPPPRQPSPEPVHTPLPSPHLRARDRLRPRTSSPLVPPGLAPPRTLVQSKSCDHLSADAEAARTEAARLGVSGTQTLRRRVRSNLEPAKYSYEPASSESSTPSHRRTFSVAHSSGLGSPAIPPVPPLPDSARGSPVFKASNVTPIYLPDLHELSPASEKRPSERKASKRPSIISLSSLASRSSSPPSPTEKQPRNIGMTCLKFFSLHKSSSRILRTGTTSS
ncbi:hypothetical protein FA15DRAFT_752837 [Coprinopsis marcescibilis]|uniref:Uncharacterized protein n=1 Tax=Coprinopsis marcescibilis TaxID=230819 RepID=A0A5C3L9F4_COPMA|nr:hypothetical protein FA15DRAFT_752837 [Coprinopsis marcescibilis]